MRKVLIALLVIVVLGGAALAYAARNLDTYMTENRELVSAQLADALGRDVSFDSVGISWAGGFGVRVEGLRVGDDPAFSQEDFLSADAVDVRVKLLPALMGRVEVGRVILRAPRVSVIQTAAGLSTDSLARGASDGGTESAAGGSPAGGASPALGIALLDMRDGALRYVDRTRQPATTLEIDQLDVRASELGLDDPVEFEAAAALFGASGQNVKVSGTVGPLAADSPRLDLDLSLDHASLDGALGVPFVRDLLPEALQGSGPLDIDADLAGTLSELSFDVSIDADDAAVKFGDTIDKAPGVRMALAAKGEKRGEQVDVSSLRVILDETDISGAAQVALGKTTKVSFDLASDAIAPAAFGVGEADDRVTDLTLTGELALAGSGPRGIVKARSPKGRVRGADYTTLVADVKLDGSRYTIQRATADAFAGKVELTGQYETGRDGTPRFDIDTHLMDMQIESLVEMVSGSGANLLNGSVDLNLDLNGAGSGWEQIRSVLNGNGDLRLANGVLKGINPAGDTLRALTQIPTFGQSGIGRVLEKYPELLGEGDTRIDDLASTFEIQQGWIQVKNVVMKTAEYVMNGAGRYSLAGELDFKTALIFGEMLSGELLGAEPDLRYIRDSDGRLALPVALRGTPPKVSVVPDISKLAGNAAREALTDVLGKALGAPGAASEAGDTATQTGGLLGGILDDALGVKRDAPAPTPDAEPEVAPPAEQAPAPTQAPVATEPVAPAPEVTAPPTPEEVGGELLRRGLGELLGGDKP